jgi:hypothetical protein
MRFFVTKDTMQQQLPASEKEDKHLSRKERFLHHFGAFGSMCGSVKSIADLIRLVLS